MSEQRNMKEYNMNYNRRGKAVIFSNEIFQFLNTRKGTKLDAKRLKHAFEHLGFEVETHEDLKLEEIKSTLKELSEDDHRDADCLAVIVMTHGDGSSKIYARDRPYQENELWAPFVDNQYCSLNNKPKLFFINVCKGSEHDKGVFVLSRHQKEGFTSSAELKVIPSTKDLLIANSCYEGFSSYRNPNQGTPYINALCDVFAERGSENHLLELLTIVNDRMADFHAFMLPGNFDEGQSETDARAMAIKSSSHKGPKQMPNFFSTLTGLVYFRPKANFS